MRRARPSAAILLLFTLTSSGCGLFYRATHRDKHFVLYADRDEEFVAEIASKARAIFEGMQNVFRIDEDALDVTWIFLEGEDDATLDYTYAPDLLGYYIPLFRLIHIDTRPAMTASPHGLEQVLLHEIAHHFIVAEYPSATNECWLNEGLAGCLEVSVIRDGHMATPLLHPTLANLARRSLREEGSERLLGELVSADWDEFHNTESREAHYALAWSAVYFLLTEHFPQSLPLGERIERLYTIDREAIFELAPRWRSFVRSLRPVDVLSSWAADRPGEHDARELRARWAIRQLGEVRGLEAVRALQRLVALLEDSTNHARHQQAALALLRLLESAPHVAIFAAEAAMSGLARVRALIANPTRPESLRTPIVDAVSPAHVTTNAWIPVLVDALDESSPSVRAAAAGALARLELKPTIANPEFWARAPSHAREREIREWRDWLSSSAANSSSLAR